MEEKNSKFWSYRNFGQGFDLVSFAMKMFPDYRRASNGVMISCPFHDDGNPSCLVQADHSYCFACGKYAWTIEFLCRVLQMEPEEVVTLNWLKKYTSDDIVFARPVKRERKYRKPNEKIAFSFHANLMQNEYALDYLYRRGLSKQTLQKFRIGYGNIDGIFSNFTGERYSIPIYDHNCSLTSIRYRTTPGGDDPKYLTHPGTASIMFNTSVLKDVHNVVYVGSQVDAMLLDQMGINAIGSASEGTILPEYAYLFSGVDVFIIPDSDLTGIRNIEKFIDAFRGYANSISVVSLATYSGEYAPKEDVNSFLSRFGPSAVIEVLNSYGYFNDRQEYNFAREKSERIGVRETV